MDEREEQRREADGDGGTRRLERREGRPAEERLLRDGGQERERERPRPERDGDGTARGEGGPGHRDGAHEQHDRGMEAPASRCDRHQERCRQDGAEDGSQGQEPP